MISAQNNLLQENQDEMDFVGSIMFDDFGGQIFSTSLVHEVTSYYLYKLKSGSVFVECYLDDVLEKSWLIHSHKEIIKLIGYSDVAKELYKALGINANKIIGGNSSEGPGFSRHIIYMEDEPDLEFLGAHLFEKHRKSDYSECEIIDLYEASNGKVICIYTDCFGYTSNRKSEIRMREFCSIEAALNSIDIDTESLSAEKI